MNKKIIAMLAAMLVCSLVLTGCTGNASVLAEKMIYSGTNTANASNTDYQNYRLSFGIDHENKETIKEALASGATSEHFDAHVTGVKGFELFPKTALGFALADDTIMTDAINYLLDDGLDANYVDQKGDSYLLCCAKNYDNNPQLMTMNMTTLLNRGADPNKLSKDGDTALDVFLQKKLGWSKKELIDAFLKHNTNITPKTLQLAVNNQGLELSELQEIVKYAKSKGSTGLSPLLEAAILGDIDAIKKELVNNNPESERYLIIACAAAFGNPDVLGNLLAKENASGDLAYQGNPLITIAAKYGNLDNVKYLHEHGESVNLKPNNTLGEYPLLDAVDGNSYDVVKYLVDQGAVPQLNEIEERQYVEEGRDPKQVALDHDLLDKAAANGNIQIAQLLFDMGASMDTMTISQDMYFAINNNQIDMFNYLMQKNQESFKVATQGDGGLLKSAAAHDNIEAVKYLLQIGADVNGVQKNYALDAAVTGQNITEVKLLLDNGAKPVMEDKEGNILTNSLISPISAGNLDMVKLLVSNGADVNAREKGQTMLQYAMWYGSKNVVEYLIKHGADLNAVYTGEPVSSEAPASSKALKNSPALGGTALHFAVLYRWRECVQVLLAAGADTTIKNSDGKTAYDLAVEDGNQPIMKLFADAGKAQGGGATPGAVDKAVGFAKGLIDKVTGQ